MGRGELRLVCDFCELFGFLVHVVHESRVCNANMLVLVMFFVSQGGDVWQLRECRSDQQHGAMR